MISPSAEGDRAWRPHLIAGAAFVPSSYSGLEQAEQIKAPATFSATGALSENGAGEETRTLDVHLGKVVLYQLSYARKQDGDKIACDVARQQVF